MLRLDCASAQSRKRTLAARKDKECTLVKSQVKFKAPSLTNLRLANGRERSLFISRGWGGLVGF